MAGPLTGIRIVDLTSMVSGPLATMTLADQGAEVIKIEHPATGDHTRLVASRRNGFSSSFLNNNRNKRSVALDLKDPRGIEAALKLCETADVFAQNFRPGVAERMGLGYDAVRARRPDIVYLSIAGFGFDGPYAGRPVFDPLIQALSGLTTVQAGADDRRPALVRTILPDKLTGIQAAQAVAAALVHRERTGEGQEIRLSMLDTLMAFLWASDMSGHTFVGREDREEKAQSWIDLIYETADGHVSIAVMTDKSWKALTRALDKPEWLDDPRFKTAADRDINKDARLKLTQEAVRDWPRTELLEQLEAHDVPCAPILTRTEARQHPQIEANGIVIETRHPKAGPLRQADHPARFSATPVDEPAAAPALGADSRAILADAGYDDDEIDALLADGVAVEPKDPKEAAE